MGFLLVCFLVLLFSFSLTIDFFSFREFVLKSFVLMQNVIMSTLWTQPSLAS